MRSITSHPVATNLLLLTVALLMSVAVGSVFIPLATMLELFRDRLTGTPYPVELQPYATILFALRLPRTALMAITGAALAGSGGAYQGLFRNPLADPYLIGVASGAGLGAILAISLHWNTTPLGLFMVPAAAFVGGLVTVWIVYQLARVGRTVPTTNLILAGVAVSSFATALTSFLMHSTGDLRRALVWLLGGSALSGWQPVIAQLPYVVVGLGIVLSMGHALNVMQVGEEQAQQLGLPVERVRTWVVVAASLSTAAAVSFAGIIGFVGLIVPHLMRMIWGPDYRKILPLSILGGATLLLIADVLARVVMAPQEIPVGIITALAGAPFFLWVLRRTRNNNAW